MKIKSLFILIIFLSCCTSDRYKVFKLNTLEGKYIVLVPDEYYDLQDSTYFGQRNKDIVVKFFLKLKDTSDLNISIEPSYCSSGYRKDNYGKSRAVLVSDLYSKPKDEIPVLNKEIFRTADFDFKSSASLQTFITNAKIKSEQYLNMYMCYTFEKVRFDIRILKKVNNSDYWSILEDIQKFKKIKIKKM